MKKSRLIQAKSLIIFGIIFSTEACFNDCLGGYKKNCKYIEDQYLSLERQEIAGKTSKDSEEIDIRHIQSDLRAFHEYFKKNTLNNSGNPLEILGGGISAYYLSKLSENKEALIYIDEGIKDKIKDPTYEGRFITSKSILNDSRKEFEKKIEEIKKLREGQPVNDIKEHIQIFKQTLDGHKTKIDNGNKNNKNVDEAMVKDIDKKYSELKEYLDNGLNIIDGDADISLNYIQNAVDFINTIENYLSKQAGAKKIEVKDLTFKVAETRGVGSMALTSASRRQELEKNCTACKKIDFLGLEEILSLDGGYAALRQFVSVNDWTESEKILKSALGDLYNSALKFPLINIVRESENVEAFIKNLSDSTDPKLAAIRTELSNLEIEIK